MTDSFQGFRQNFHNFVNEQGAELGAMRVKLQALLLRLLSLIRKVIA